MSQQPPWPQGQIYPTTQPYPPIGPGHGYVPPTAAVRTSVTGARVMTIVGAALLVVAAVLLALAVPTIASSIPVHMVDRAGNPGSAAVAGLNAADSTAVNLQAGYYDVFLASNGTFAALDGAVTVAADDGSQVEVTDPTVTTSFTMIDTYVVSVASFHVARAGLYVVTVPAVAPQDAKAVLGQGKDAGTLAAAGVELAGAIVLGLTGLGLTIGGGIWWGRRSRRRKSLAAWQAGSPAGAGPGVGYPPR